MANYNLCIIMDNFNEHCEFEESINVFDVRKLKLHHLFMDSSLTAPWTSKL